MIDSQKKKKACGFPVSMQLDLSESGVYKINLKIIEVYLNFCYKLKQESFNMLVVSTVKKNPLLLELYLFSLNVLTKYELQYVFTN